MIYNKFSYAKFEQDYLKKIDEFLKNNDLTKFDSGIHKIAGDDFFVNICDYTTTTDDNRVWEAHRKYLDVHVMIKGCETLKHTYIENVTIKEYNEDSDYVEIKDVSTVDSVINLREGQYLIFELNDVHKTALILDDAQEVRKAIFKVRV